MKKNAEIYYASFLELKSYAAVARRYGLSRTYIRQVLVDAGYDLPTRSMLSQKIRAFAIGKELSEKLDQVAKEHGNNASHHVRAALQHYIENDLYKEPHGKSSSGAQPLVESSVPPGHSRNPGAAD